MSTSRETLLRGESRPQKTKRDEPVFHFRIASNSMHRTRNSRFSFFLFFLFSISQFEGTAGQSIGNGRQRAVDTFRLKLLLPPWIQSTCNNLYNYLSTRCRKFLWIYYICYTIFRNFDSTIKWNTSIPIILAIRPRKPCLVAVLRKFHNVSYNPYIVNS